MTAPMSRDASGWVERAMELADDMTSAAFHSARCACAADPIVRAASDRWADDRDTYQKQLRAHLTAQSALAEQMGEALRIALMEHNVLHYQLRPTIQAALTAFQESTQ